MGMHWVQPGGHLGTGSVRTTRARPLISDWQEVRRFASSPAIFMFLAIAS